MPIIPLLSENEIQLLAAITALLFAAKTFRDSLSLLWLFQTKEYRLDRTRAHFRDNLRFNLSDVATAIAAFALLAAFFPATAQFVTVFLLISLGNIAPLYFLYEVAKSLWSTHKHSLKRPRPTLKIMLISGVYLASYLFFIFSLSSYVLERVNIIYSFDFFVLFSLYLLLLNALAPLFVLLAIALVTPFSNFQKKKIIRRASQKMSGMKHVKTIGITGSFGKTSTKEILYAILSTKYKTIKTEGNNNTDMGVARTVLTKVNDEYDFFICEMGAYRIGEIKTISGIARPFAGIITGINEQHLDLFGSLQNTKIGKFELIESLPEDGFAVINKEAYELQPQVSFKVKDVAFFDKEDAKNVGVFSDHVEFTYKEKFFTASLSGKHYIGNLLAAIITAEKAGMDLEEIREALQKADFSAKYLMKRIDGPERAVFIDDSYSANPDGVMAALEYMEDAYPKSKKVLVFPGIIELGKDSEKIQEKLWEKADEICSMVYAIRKKDRGMKEKYKKSRFIFEKNFDKIAIDLRKHLDSNTVVLFESRAAAVVMKKLLNQTNKK